MADIVSMPKLGFDMAEGTLVRWVIQEGHPVTKGAVLAEIETDKATVEVESNFDGIVIRHLVPQGEIVPVGSPIAVIGEENEQVTLTDQAMVGDKAVDEQKITAPVSVTEDIRATGSQTSDEQLDVQLPGGVRASPVARRMAEEQGVDLKKVMGSGPTGRITRKDIEGYISSRRVSAPTPDIVQVTSPAAIKEVIVERNVTDETIPLSRLRAAIGRRMVESVQNIPHFYVTHNYDMAAIVNLRKQINMLLPDNEKLSVNDFILKAVALTLRDFPNLNASLGEGNNAIVRHGKINVGSAVAVETGLLTVVCHDTDLKSLRQISIEVREMANRARDGKVRPDDIEGSTFTVSNLGMFDVEQFTAIINPPEAAILAVGTAQEVPVVKDGQLGIGVRMKATLSVDHRISDGAEGARFLQSLTRFIEEPLRLLV